MFVTSVNDDVSHDINVSRVLRSMSVYDVSYDDDVSHKHGYLRQNPLLKLPRSLGVICEKKSNCQVCRLFYDILVKSAWKSVLQLVIINRQSLRPTD